MKGRKGCSRWGEGSAMLIIFDCKSLALARRLWPKRGCTGSPCMCCVVRCALCVVALGVGRCYLRNAHSGLLQHHHGAIASLSTPESAPRHGVNDKSPKITSPRCVRLAQSTCLQIDVTPQQPQPALNFFVIPLPDPPDLHTRILCSTPGIPLQSLHTRAHWLFTAAPPPTWSPWWTP